MQNYFPKLFSSYSSSEKLMTAEDTVNQNIMKNLFLCFLHCPGEVSLRNKTTCLSANSSICAKSVVSLQVSLANKGILLWCTWPYILEKNTFKMLSLQ